MRRTYLSRVFFTVVGLLWSTLTLGATLHVAASRDSGMGSAFAPFGSIPQAIEAAKPGDTVIIHAGTYLLKRAITVDKADLKITAISGEPVVITADEQVPALFIITADAVTLQDLTLQGGFYGIKIDVDNTKSTHRVAIEHCQIGSTAADCMKIFNADDLRIENCRIGPSGWKQKDNAEGIDIVGSVGVTIRGCLVENISTNGIYLKGGTRNGVVERCLIRKCGNGGILLGQDTDQEFMRDGAANEAIDCVARNNIIVDTKTAGLGTYSGKNVAFYNNTLVNTASEGQAAFWIVANSRDVPAEKVTFRNNLVISSGRRPILFVKDASGLPECDYNLYQVAGSEPRFVREISGDDSLNRDWTLAQWQQASGNDSHSRQADAKIDLGLYRPLAGSPVIGAGCAISGIDTDYFGRKRVGPAWDIGAVTASPPASQPAIPTPQTR